MASLPDGMVRKQRPGLPIFPNHLSSLLPKLIEQRPVLPTLHHRFKLHRFIISGLRFDLGL